jgi:UDP-glucose 4-epimerase
MTFLVIGGKGYLGGRLSDWLRSNGHRVLVASRTAGRNAYGDVLPWPIVDVPERIDTVVHLASPDQNAAAADPAGFLATSAELAWTVCDLASRLQPAPLLLYVSTFHVYGNQAEGLITEALSPRPSHPYALGKWMGEQTVQYFRHRGLSALCLRLSNAFGAPANPDMSQWHLLFNDLCRQAVSTGSLVVRSVAQKRNFITIEDVCRAIEFVAHRPGCRPPDGILHVGSELNLTVAEVAEIVAERARLTLGREVEVRGPSDTSRGGRDFEFSIVRLRDCSFAWTNPVNREIDETLRICTAMTVSPAL